MKKLILVTAIVALSACSGGRGGAETSVRENLKDPDSAKFGEFYYNDTTKKGCLEVNAKNSMGGYTGFQQAQLKYTAEGWETDDIVDLTWNGCKTDFADKAD